MNPIILEKDDLEGVANVMRLFGSKIFEVLGVVYYHSPLALARKITNDIYLVVHYTNAYKISKEYILTLCHPKREHYYCKELGYLSLSEMKEFNRELIIQINDYDTMPKPQFHEKYSGEQFNKTNRNANLIIGDEQLEQEINRLTTFFRKHK